MAPLLAMGVMCMGKENNLMVDYLRDNHRFADLFNGGLFAGKCVVKADELDSAGENYTEFSVPPADKPAEAVSPVYTVPRSRDVIKRLRCGATLRILAVEEQSSIDYTMPWRCMNYDALEYGRQVKDIQRLNREQKQALDHDEFLCGFRKTDRLSPVYTLCLYHGTKAWDGPRNLREMMQFGSDEERELWEQNFSDYPLRLICVNELQNTACFTTGLKELFGVMPYRDDKHAMAKFFSEHEEYEYLDEETALIIGGIIGAKKFMDNKEKYEHEGGYNMCLALKEMMEDSELAGIEKGISQGISLSAAIFRAVKAGQTDNVAIAAKYDCTMDEVEKIRSAFGL